MPSRSRRSFLNPSQDWPQTREPREASSRGSPLTGGEDDEVRRAGKDRGQCVPAVGDALDLIAGPLEELAEGVPPVPVIVNDEDRRNARQISGAESRRPRPFRPTNVRTAVRMRACVADCSTSWRRCRWSGAKRLRRRRGHTWHHSEGGDSLNDPEHRHASDGIRRDELCPLRCG
jgi:hypothetical protein